MWNPLRYLYRGSVSDDEFLRRRAELLSHAPIPCLWLFGKTGSGKTSIVRYLTGATDAVIGRGFRPQTRFSRLFSFPDEELPIVRFLDTRGLGEANYDPTADLAEFHETAHLVVVTVRATDQATEEIIRPLRTIRHANSKRPVLLVVTCLHDAYPGEQHPELDPFDTSQRPLPESIPTDLRRSIEAHYERFDGLFDRAVPIDLTPPEEGFANPDFGGDRLKQAILDLLPAAYRQTLLQMDQLPEAIGEMHQRRTAPVILAHSALAASAAAVPIPWVDLPVVLAIQSHMAHRLARLNRQRLDASTLANVTCAVGGRIAFRMGLREALKFIPWVGMAVNATAAFALTYASGWVWSWYFLQIKQGHIPTPEELRQVYREQLETGARVVADVALGAKAVISRRSIVLGFLALVPVLIYLGLGGYALWTTGLLVRLWWLLPVCWALTWVVAKLWRPARPTSHSPLHDVSIPDHWTPRDREAAEIIREYQRRVEQFTPEQLTNPQFYQAQAQELAVVLARHYHPKARDPYSSLTVPEVLAAVRLVVDDMEQWMLESVPGSRLLTIKHWKMLQSAPLWYRRLRDTTWVASMLINPINIARYFSSTLTMDPVTTELQTELLAVVYLRFMRQMGIYLIEMNSGRLRAGADAYRRAFQIEPGGLPDRISETSSARTAAAQSVTVSLVGQVSSGKSSLVNALTGTNQAAVDILPETKNVRRFQIAVGEPPVTVTLLDTPGYGEAGASADQLRQIRSALQESNCVLLVMDAHSPAREADLQTVRDLETWYASQPRFKPPAVLGVLTHVDLLRPTLEWSPPYNWREPSRPKEHTIHEAVAYVRGLFGSSLAAIVPVCADARPQRAWGILEELVPALTSILDNAQSVALLRAFEKELDRGRFKTLLKQFQRSGSELLRGWIEERLSAPSE